MPRPFITILALVLIAAFALSAGCTLTTPGQPGTTPSVTVTRTGTPIVTGTVATTATHTLTATVTSTPTRTVTATATATTSGGEGGPDSIAGVKWNDLNGDHKRSAGEPVLSGWTIRLDRQEQNGANWDEVARDVTDANGAYSFTGLAPGHYRVYEVAQTGWTQTFPTNADGMHNLVISIGQPSWTGLDFGNTGGPGVTGTTTATTTGATATPTAGATATLTATPTLTTVPTGTGGTVTYYADILTARNLAFDKASFTVPAGATVALTFINDDAGVPHNFALYTDSSAATAIFKGAIVTGQQTTLYTFTAPSTRGTYFFRCDVHPTQMTGSFVVV